MEEVERAEDELCSWCEGSGFVPAGSPLPSWVEWQPVETAPKDGSMVLLFGVKASERRNNGGVAMGYWHQPSAHAVPTKGTWITNVGSSQVNITHWMPLPSPPA